MKTLILMRHAKSSWAEPELEDHERPLNPRGKASAPVMARWLKSHGLVPDCVLCSSSKRTRQTVKRMCKAVPAIPEPEIVPALYEAMPEDILDAVRQAPPQAGIVLVLGHEPGMSATAGQLADGSESEHCREAFGHFPTAALAVFELDDAEWRDLAGGRARFSAFVRPRDLAEAGA